MSTNLMGDTVGNVGVPPSSHAAPMVPPMMMTQPVSTPVSSSSGSSDGCVIYETDVNVVKYYDFRKMFLYLLILVLILFLLFK